MIGHHTLDLPSLEEVSFRGSSFDQCHLAQFESSVLNTDVSL